MVKSSLEITHLLINFGTDVNITDNEGCAPLGIIIFRICFLDPVQVSMLGMRGNRHCWNACFVIMGS